MTEEQLAKLDAIVGLGLVEARQVKLLFMCMKCGNNAELECTTTTFDLRYHRVWSDELSMCMKCGRYGTDRLVGYRVDE